EFRLEPTAEGTRLTVTESGFEAIPNPRRLEVLRGNTEGRNIPGQNIADYVEQAAYAPSGGGRAGIGRPRRSDPALPCLPALRRAAALDQSAGRGNEADAAGRDQAPVRPRARQSRQARARRPRMPLCGPACDT